MSIIRQLRTIESWNWDLSASSLILLLLQECLLNFITSSDAVQKGRYKPMLISAQ